MNEYKKKKLIESKQREKKFKKLIKFSKRTIGTKRSRLLKRIDTETEQNKQSIIPFKILEDLSKANDASQYATVLSELFDWNININNDKQQVVFSKSLQ